MLFPEPRDLVLHLRVLGSEPGVMTLGKGVEQLGPTLGQALDLLSDLCRI